MHDLLDFDIRTPTYGHHVHPVAEPPCDRLRDPPKGRVEQEPTGFIVDPMGLLCNSQIGWNVRGRYPDQLVDTSLHVCITALV